MLRARLVARSCLPWLILVTMAPCARADEAPASEFQIISNEPGLSLHKEMYGLPYTYANEYHGRQTEAVFQLSAKYRVLDTRLYFAYTQISFWQAYDYRASSPFRDTNYNPEVFYRFPSQPIGSGRAGADAGFEHESNGQRLPLSRSWNLLYMAPWYERGSLLGYVKLRYRIPEKAKTSPDDAVGDDNPDITDYLGYSDVHVYYRLPHDNMVHVTVRGIVGSGKGRVDLHYSLPLSHERSYLLLSFGHGYGESLLDYRKSITRVGIGIMFAR
jgi:phospholipase A1